MASPFPTNYNPGKFLLLAIISLSGLCALVGCFSIKWNRLLYLHMLIHMWCFDKLLCTFLIVLVYISFDSIYKAFNLFEYSLESLLTFLRAFFNIPRNPLEYSQDSSWTFPGISSKIPRNLFEHPWNLFKHSPESSWTFPGIFFNIPRNVKIITFPGIL